MNIFIIIIILLVIVYLYDRQQQSSKPKRVHYKEQPEIIGEIRQQKEETLEDTIKKYVPGLPYPKISRDAQVSNSVPGIFSNKIQNPTSILIKRDTNPVKNRQYLPDYYRKDTLSGNTIGTTELRSFTDKLDEADNAWTDSQVSVLPGYHTNNVENGLTNPGSFYNKNNQYRDLQTPQSEALVTDRCYKDKDGRQFCLDNTRLQNIPPSLIENPRESQLLKNIGMQNNGFHSKSCVCHDCLNTSARSNVETINGNSYVSWDYANDKVMNGSNFGMIKGSHPTNEQYSPLLNKYAQSQCVSN